MEYSFEKIEQEIFNYVDQVKELLSPEIWQNVLLDCSKNEILILWLLFRKHEVNMSQIADYVHVPLNTATGIISRMEMKKLVVRERSLEDKRVVTIKIGESGNDQIKLLLNECMYYGKEVTNSFSSEEIELFFQMLNKIIDLMKTKNKQDSKPKQIRKISIE